MEPLLEALLYRNHCPNPERLLDYHLGRLPTTLDAEVRQHLVLCRFCSEELADIFQTDLAEAITPVQAGLWQRLRQRLRHLVPHGPVLPAIEQLANVAPALRSDTQPETMRIYEAGEYRISLVINQASDRASATLEGSVIHQNDPLQTISATVHLLDAEKEVAQSTLDEFGLFAFLALAPGSYTLLIQFPTQSICIQDFSV